MVSVKTALRSSERSSAKSRVRLPPVASKRLGLEVRGHLLRRDVEPVAGVERLLLQHLQPGEIRASVHAHGSGLQQELHQLVDHREHPGVGRIGLLDQHQRLRARRRCRRRSRCASCSASVDCRAVRIGAVLVAARAAPGEERARSPRPSSPPPARAFCETKPIGSRAAAIASASACRIVAVALESRAPPPRARRAAARPRRPAPGIDRGVDLDPPGEPGQRAGAAVDEQPLARGVERAPPASGRGTARSGRWRSGRSRRRTPARSGRAPRRAPRASRRRTARCRCPAATATGPPAAPWSCISPPSRRAERHVRRHDVRRRREAELEDPAVEQHAAVLPNRAPPGRRRA